MLRTGLTSCLATTGSARECSERRQSDQVSAERIRGARDQLDRLLGAARSGELTAPSAPTQEYVDGSPWRG
jgi:hypothetical protein